MKASNSSLASGPRVHWIQHVPFEGLGSIEPWLAGRGARVSVSRMFENPVFPRLDDLDFLIVMGGPMSVNDEKELPWLREEKKFIDDAITAGLSVLGICLGAQLIASARGAAVRRGRRAEIGWFPVERVRKGDSGALFAALPARAEVFHWHGETFDLPPGARHLARSEACENQAFSLGDRVLGLQFHLETTPAGVRDLIANSGSDLVPGPYIQSPKEMLGPASRFTAVNAVLDGLLETFAGSARRGLDQKNGIGYGQ